MGWTLFACFGGTNKRKRPKSASKFGSKSRRRIRGYEPLHSDNSKVLDAPQTLGGTREKPKDETKTRIRKKVRFNLEVVTYEPLSSQEDDHDDNNWEERGDEKTDQATAAVEACLICAPLSKTISTESKLPLYSSNYRYNCCYDGEDEYDEVEDDDDYGQLSDDEDDDDDIDNDYEDDDSCTIDPQSTYNEKVTEELRDCSSVPLISSATNARLRSHYIVPVLNPIENLSQWKTVKTRKC
ncbi:lateral signaling target protein 2 homolog [Chenopodium quinoa]|uniref:lateral signaling target protein 2 homolog n=1 Tax=Chenopodium quinoa TaxID=63459 RepID=UPI000B77A016|nr:lateral signaling target protein 2 homolog [Chenopodium quinoa]